MTAPAEVTEPFTFTAFADDGIPGPSLDQDPSLQPESAWFMWNNGSFEPSDPFVHVVVALHHQVRGPVVGRSSRLASPPWPSGP